MTSEKGKASDEVFKLTQEMKEFALKSRSGIVEGADLVGFIPVERLDEIPSYRQDWMDTSTMKTTDQMKDAKSIILLGYHASDDVYEVVVRKGDSAQFLGYLPFGIKQRELIRQLQANGFEAKVADDRLPKKQMARLAGFGNYGKNALIITPKYGPWIRLAAIVTNAEFVYDEPFDKDLCGYCDKCVKACPTGALTPYRIDYTKCLVNPYDFEDWAKLISGELKFSEKFSKTPDVDTIFSKHSPRFTDNSVLMCMACQKACPYGRKERGLEK